MTVDAQLLEQARSNDADARQKAAASLSHRVDETSLPLMFELLGDRDWRVRKTVLEGFLRRPDEAVVRGLIESLRDPENAGKRNSATETLIRIGDLAIPQVIRQLSIEDDVDVRLSLVNLLGDLRSDSGLAALLELITVDPDLNVTSSAVTSIGKHRQASTIPALLRLLAREDVWLKFHVIEALGEIGDRSALPAILPLYAEKSLRKPVLEAVGRISDVGTVNFLLRVITDEEKLNLTALRALVQIADAEKPRVVQYSERQVLQRKFRELFPPSKIPPLIEQLGLSSKREVKFFILKFLGWSGDERALLPMLEHLEHPDYADVAAQGLIDFGAGAVSATLERLRSSEEDEVTALLLKVVNIIGGAEAVSTVLMFLDHENASIRRLAIETLGQILDPGTVDYLLAKMDDPDVASQQAAVNSISSLVAAYPEVKQETLQKVRRLLNSSSVPVKLNSLSIFVNIQGEGYHDELLLASKDEDPVLRQKAVSLMGKFSEERFADQIVLSLTDEATTVRVAAINALVKLRPEKGLAPLLGSLEDSDTWIRTAAAQALGEYRSGEAVVPLVEHLRTDVMPVKIAAIEALGKSGQASVTPILFECLQDSDSELQRAALLALAELPGEEVFLRLSAALRDADWRLRAAAASALGVRGDRRVLSALHELLVSDPDNYVKQAAVLALERIGDPSSFSVLLRALENSAILDDVSDVFVRHKDVYRTLLEEAWRTADSRHELTIAAILRAMKGSSKE